MHNSELEKIINHQLDIHQFNDFAPNGLQVEGRRDVQRIVTGVTASQALIEAAIELDADALLVHHGYFWKSESPKVIGMKRNRLKSLLCNNINLYAYHLPLDAHPELGNNARLAHLLGISQANNRSREECQSLLQYGAFESPLTAYSLTERLESLLGRKVLHCGDSAPKLIRHIAWCSGGGQDYIEQAAVQGADAFITGEVSERTIHAAREMGIHFFAAGHHATERYGIKALGEWLAENYGLDAIFVDIDNPA